jgi:sulfoxide reductase heme-binding subunit YedZ
MTLRFFAQPWNARPWRERNGQFSWLKLTVFLALFVPGLLTLSDLLQHHLGARPLTELIRQTGLWTLRFLLISLAITPLRRALHWPRLVLVRRMVGVAAFFYGLAHLGAYIADQSFHLGTVASEIALRIYLTIGFTTLLLMAILAATSTDGMIKRLGGKAWRRLHQLAYGIGMLALLHYFMQSKLGFGEPLFMAALFGWAMGYRAIGWLGGEESTPRPRQAAALSLSVALLTALGEALYVHFRFHVDVLRVLKASLAWQLESRSAWAVLAIGLVIALASAVRATIKRRQRRQRGRIAAIPVPA